MQMQCKCLLRIAVISYNKVAFSQSQSMAFFVSSISMASISCLAHGIGSVGVRMYINGMHVLCTIRTCVRGGQGEDCKWVIFVYVEAKFNGTCTHTRPLPADYAICFHLHNHTENVYKVLPPHHDSALFRQVFAFIIH